MSVSATQQLIAAITEHPGLSARELAVVMRRQGARVSKSDLNPLLYRDSRFEHDGGSVPRWRLAGAAPKAGFDRKEIAREQRADRSRLDDVQRLVAAHRATTQPDASRRPARQDAPALKPATTRPVMRHARPERLAAPEWLLSLHPWQQEALSAWYDAGGHGVCEAVTGTGKTHLGLEAVAQVVARGERATVLVPSLLLQRQWEQRLERYVPHAVLAKLGGKALGNVKTADVVIAVVNSAVRQDLSALPGMTLLVADETHRYGGESWALALRPGYAQRLGLTATLERSSDDGVEESLLPFFGSVVHKYGFDRAGREGIVAAFDLAFLGVRLDGEEQAEYDKLSRSVSKAAKVLVGAGGKAAMLSRDLGRLRAMGGEVSRAAMVYEQATRQRRRLLADTESKHIALTFLAEYVGESTGTVIFTQSKEAAHASAEVLKEYGLKAAAVYSEGMTPKVRQQLLDDLADRQLDALAAPKILDEGVDIPEVDLGIVLGASSSRRQMIQRLGRVIRKKDADRKARFVILYVVGSVEDPQQGRRDDFMDEVENAATTVALFEDWDESELETFWSGAAPAWDRTAESGEDAEVAESAPVTVTSRPVRRTEPVARLTRTSPPPRPPARPDATQLTALLEELDDTLALIRVMRSMENVEPARSSRAQ